MIDGCCTTAFPKSSCRFFVLSNSIADEKNILVSKINVMFFDYFSNFCCPHLLKLPYQQTLEFAFCYIDLSHPVLKLYPGLIFYLISFASSF